MKNCIRLSLLAIVLLSIAACADKPSGQNLGAEADSVTNGALVSARSDNSRSPDIELTVPEEADQDDLARRSEIYRGTGIFFDREALKRHRGAVATGDSITLNFVDADLREVLKAVLDDILGLNFAMDPGIGGSITLQSSRPIPRSDVLMTLETVLRLNGLALVEVDDIYQIVPLGDAAERATLSFVDGPTQTRRPGFGIEIVPLQYVSAPEMRKILLPFAPDQGIFRVDAARNILFIAGTAQERSAMTGIIDVFDVDWLESMSFALYSLDYVEAQAVIDELQEILAGPESPLIGLVRLIPMPRINAILAISARPGVLEHVETWIDRLDTTRQASGRRIFIYHVQNSRADDLAASLNRIMGGGSLQRGTSIGESRPGAPVRTGASAPGRPSTGSTGRPGVPTAPGDEAARGSAYSDDSSAFRVVADEKSNALLIYATPGEFAVVKAALEQLDTAPHQVLIEAAIVEVSLSDDLQYGVQWLFRTGDSTVTFSDSSSGAVTSQFPGFSFTRITSSIQTAINTIASVTDVNVLSSPKILVLNNQSAILQVGDQVPIATQSAVSITDPGAPIVNTVQFRDTGVILTVTPRINKSGLVIIEVALEVSDVVSTTTSGIDSPTIQQRKIVSTVAVHGGETIALGGLIRETESRSNSGIPFLKDIPFLGAAFRSANNTLRRTELLIFITPRVIRSMQDARDTTEYLRRQLRNMNIEEMPDD